MTENTTIDKSLFEKVLKLIHYDYVIPEENNNKEISLLVVLNDLLAPATSIFLEIELNDIELLYNLVFDQELDSNEGLIVWVLYRFPGILENHNWIKEHYDYETIMKKVNELKEKERRDNVLA